jgi:hypothetical protein
MTAIGFVGPGVMGGRARSIFDMVTGTAAPRAVTDGPRGIPAGLDRVAA